MRCTRRLWGVAALAAVLSLLAVAFEQPILFAGAALIGGSVLARQSLFVRSLERTASSLSVTQTPVQASVRTGETIPVTVEATLETPSALALSIEGGLPTAASGAASPSLTLEPGRVRSGRTIDVSWPVAGRHRFDSATIAATDGYFAETISVGDRPTVTAEPRTTRHIHVGEGGDPLGIAYGEHRGGHLGAGIDPEEVRRYVPGDTIRQIDWNATARLDAPHIREYAPETDRQTVLVVDHRAALATGPPGETELDYLREVALATAASAIDRDDPVGLVTVGDDGVTARHEPGTTRDQHVTIRRRLFDLEPTVESASRSSVAVRTARRTSADVQQTATVLERDDAFTTALRPFYENQAAYRERLESEPLHGAVRSTLARHRGGLSLVVFADDSSPAELREIAAFARRERTDVLFLLAPAVLFEPGELADLEAAYDRYLEFEELRRDLARIPDVTAAEVAPDDRFSSVLEAGRRKRGDRR